MITFWSSDNCTKQGTFWRGLFMQKLKQSTDDGIGQNLKRLRENKKLTQIDVVRELEFFGC